MKKLQLAVVSLLALQFVWACNGNAQTEQTAPVQTEVQAKAPIHKNISVKEFTELMNSMGNEQILDVRTPGEWKSGIIEGATTANWFDADFNEQIAALDKNKPVLVYCASGGRSAKAMQKLSTMGFTEVYNMLGGMNAWKGSGNEVVTK